jgi:hypothetical protein
MNNLKNAVGLLNAQAPEGEFLAYINADEAKMLKDAGGAGLLTPQGIPTYFSAMYGGGAGDRGGDPRASAAENVSAGRDDRGNVQRAEDYRRQQNQTNTPPTVIEEPTFTGEDYDSTDLADPPKGKVESFFDGVKEFVLGGGMIGNATKFIEKLGKPIQTKMMTYSLNKRLEKIYKDNPDFEDYESLDEIPGEIGSRVVDLEKDLQGVRDGTFTQNDFTKKYGSGDATNPNDASFNPATLRENDITDLETYFAPELADIIGGTAPQESMVNEYFANANNQNLGISSDYMTTYNKAKEDLAKTLNMTANADQFGYSGTMTASNIYYNYLKEQGLL